MDEFESEAQVLAESLSERGRSTSGCWLAGSIQQWQYQAIQYTHRPEKVQD